MALLHRGDEGSCNSLFLERSFGLIVYSIYVTYNMHLCIILVSRPFQLYQIPEAPGNESDPLFLAGLRVSRWLFFPKKPSE